MSGERKVTSDARQMGRPRLDAGGAKRKRRGALFATDAEWDAIQKAAELAGVSWQDFLLRRAGFRQ